jgi:hypothetical protein
LRIEGEHGGVVADRDDQASRESLDLHGVAGGGRLRDGRGAGLPATNQAGGKAVQEPGQQPPAAEAGPAGQTLENFGLHGEPDSEAGPLDIFGGTAAAVDLEQVPGVALQLDAQVGADLLVVAAGHLVEHVPLRTEQGDAAVGGQQAG